ncbi:MAG TPA: hemolysin family protein [Candidatus Absconditabacterales bacterium]|nr:hemolysin family protein [Candidatus Absconditabacterales bacterium]
MDRSTILIFVILFLLSAFFSGSETAFMSIPEHKIEAFLKQKKFGARELKKLRSNNDRLLITILIGNNLINVFTASLATSIAIQISNTLGSAQSMAIGISTGVITLLLLLFGEIFPKTLATRYADKISLSVSKIYIILQIILYPVVVSVDFVMKLLQKKSSVSTVTDEEVEAFIDLGKNSGVFEKGEYEKIKNMLDFYEITCEEIMTPRIKIDALDTKISVDEAIEKMFKFSHSRILVYNDDIDHIEWVVTLKELLLVRNKGMGSETLDKLSLSPVIKVPLTKPIHSLLDIFKKQRKHVAIVIDEYGGVAGLVSLEDVVEEVFGEIQDETDREIDPIRPDNNGGYLFQSEVRVDEMLAKFGLEFENVGLDEKEFGGETLGYFVTSCLQRFPKKGDEIEIKIDHEDIDIKGNLFLKIESVEKNIIGDIKVGIYSR